MIGTCVAYFTDSDTTKKCSDSDTDIRIGTGLNYTICEHHRMCVGVGRSRPEEHDYEPSASGELIITPDSLI